MLTAVKVWIDLLLLLCLTTSRSVVSVMEWLWAPYGLHLCGCWHKHKEFIHNEINNTKLSYPALYNPLLCEW